MNDDLQTVLGLPAVEQVGLVVKDLEKAIQLYEPVFGRFEVSDYVDMQWDYRGRSETCSIKSARCRSGDVEIELIEWVSGETPHKEFIEAGREGLHHLRFLVDNVDEKITDAKTLGYEPIWYKRFTEGLAAVYLERKGDPLIIELFENLLG